MFSINYCSFYNEFDVFLLLVLVGWYTKAMKPFSCCCFFEEKNSNKCEDKICHWNDWAYVPEMSLSPFATHTYTQYSKTNHDQW